MTKHVLCYLFIVSLIKVGTIMAGHRHIHTTHIHSISGCIFVVLSVFMWILCVFICICSFSVYVAYVAAFWRNK